MEGAHGLGLPKSQVQGQLYSMPLKRPSPQAVTERETTARWFPGVAEGRAATVLAMLLFFASSWSGYTPC